jgi:DNA-binding winged helix-turn-helix (wHTH) protein/tetratricopeptide (TPR) repeat protein
MSSNGNASDLNFVFEDYVLKPSERVLLRNGDPVPLKAKVFETLLSLVRNHNKVLSKEELMQQVWADRYVEEGNLSQYIFMLRRIFGEKPKDHRFIVTIPGYGYRFVAKVDEIPGTPDRYQNGHHIAENGHIRSIAILPLRFLDPTQQDEFLGLALADTLITRLSANRSVSVRPTAAIVRYTKSEKDPLDIGREVRADAILSGTIYKHHGDLLVNMQLAGVHSEEILWAKRFEVKPAEFLDLQSSIAGEVSDALAIELNDGGQPRNIPRKQASYQKYLKGRFHWEKRTESGLREGLECVRGIVESEPDFPHAYIGIADSYLLLGEYLYLAPEESFPQARAAAEQAVRLDPKLAEGYASLAEYFHYFEKDWARSDELFERSLRLNQNYASARHSYAWSLMCRGKFDAALENLEIAQSLDPSSLILNTSRGLPFYFGRDHRQAIRQFRIALEMDPRLIYGRYYLASALLHSGDPEGAVREFEQIVEEEPLQQAVALLGFSYAEAGRWSDAREQLDRLELMGRGRYVSPYVMAVLHCGLGETDTALCLLEEACAEKAPWTALMRIDPYLSCLYGEPRFIKLLEKLGLD